ncbi:MAG: amino acid ABC transporter substrate-binding protein, partial [Alphaproteobacteria bacterium]
MYSKKLLFVLVSILLLVAVVGCAAPQQAATTASETSLDTIIKSGKIKIAIPQDTPLFGTQAADGSYAGYDVDVAKMIGKDLGVEVELVPVTS